MRTRTRVSPRKVATTKAIPPRAVREASRSVQTPKQVEIVGSTPLPIRITAEQQAQLVKKRERTGVPIQELVRRAIDHMLATVDIGAVPERR
jgi:hypothetical protein